MSEGTYETNHHAMMIKNKSILHDERLRERIARRRMSKSEIGTRRLAAREAQRAAGLPTIAVSAFDESL